ncbi:hypothetical protein MBAV_000801 [Candidatus Magnetobacterium bavaricum]|uniref:Uncharacterized protein n=1 Tax=Candidatus Magnetobacterium bavaricum TaxID=29290 RepID=A0A0F3GYU0_9BACT|nr:hypothetical protein MBAV_000801 [Candidatus Magnetobacterium bavaricum]
MALLLLDLNNVTTFEWSATEHSYHRTLYEDNGDEEFLDLFFYCIPRDQDTQDCGQCRQQHRSHRHRKGDPLDQGLLPATDQGHQTCSDNRYKDQQT